MANIISLQERVQGRYFDRSNFSQNYDRLPEESQQRVARMAIGFFIARVANTQYLMKWFG